MQRTAGGQEVNLTMIIVMRRVPAMRVGVFPKDEEDGAGETSILYVDLPRQKLDYGDAFEEKADYSNLTLTHLTPRRPRTRPSVRRGSG